MDKASGAGNGPSLHSRRSTSTPNNTRTAHSALSSEPPASNPKGDAAARSSRSSPLASRESSPSRTLRSNYPKAPSAAAGTRSRKNSQGDLSPSRSQIPAPPAATRALSAASTPALLPSPSDPHSRAAAPGPQKNPSAAEYARDAPRWPISPRLRSPPPVLNRPSLGPSKKGEQEPPSLSIQRSAPSPSFHHDLALPDDDTGDSSLQPGPRTPARAGNNSASTLETVQEASPLSSPKPSADHVMGRLEDSIIPEAGSQPDLYEASASKSLKPRANAAANESGSESGAVQADRRPAPSATALPPPLTSRQSSTSNKNASKSKPAEGSAQSMTVETETVTSIPQVAVAPAVAKDSSNGSLRTKPSSETIRPKREKKKPPRKQPSVAAGNASSKADIFEAKVASAVDEANTSDSEETFVYDSNPPDGGDRPRRFHSRTPSATSMVSQVDRSGMRSLHGVMEGAGPSLAIRKNMKFVSTFNSSGNDSGAGDDETKGTGRSNTGSGRGTSRGYHHHIGRWGRSGGGNGHTSLFDNEAPFHINASTAQRSLFPTNNLRQSSGPPSPRFSSARAAANGKRGMQMAAAAYDLDDTTGADDERTPLVQGSVRSGRSGRSRRHAMALRALEGQTRRGAPSFLNRFASCLVLTVMLLLVVSGAIGFMFATSQPLSDIELVALKNVVASEQELMLDVTVKAHNPNVVVVIIDSADVEVFAKSPHAGTDSEWWRRPHDSGTFSLRRKPGGDLQSLDDPINDPPLDDTAPNMRLGTIREFDSPLSFEGSFFHQGISASTGEVRLKQPGNGTDHGTERWERILQDEFDLILKGVVKYSLPLSQRIRSVAISGRTTVKPNSANDPTLQPNSTDVSIS